MTGESALSDRDGPLLDRGSLALPGVPASFPDDAGAGREDVDPQFAVTFAAAAVCHSDSKIHCGLTVIPAGRAPETIASSDDLPVRVDWMQRELAQGPAVNPYLGEVLVSEDLAADQRWPDLGRLCVAALDLRSMVSIRVPMAASDRARLNFYAADPTALDHLDIDAALGLARVAAPATGRLLGEFRQALLDAAPSDFSRIAIAVGIVIARYRLSSSQAFDMLLHTASGLDRALLDVALEVVQRGRLPDGPPARMHQRRPHPSPEPHGDNTVQTPHGRARHVGGPNMWREPAPAFGPGPADADTAARPTKPA